MNSSSLAHSFLSRYTFAVLFGAAVSLHAQTPVAPGSAAATAKEEAIMLSPFQVSTDAEKGYLATQTLNGTRLKSDLRDIGSALTIFTKELMDDLSANNVNDLLMFAPNTDPYIIRLTDVTGSGNDFILADTQYVTRGGRTDVVGQDFFANTIPGDRYNSEAFTFSRGPNAILFGLGNPAGAFVSSIKRAKNQTATTVDVKVDDRNSYRGSIDHNQVIKKDLLSLRYAGLYEKTFGFRIPAPEGIQRRQFVTASFTPFKRTTFRVNYEQGVLKIPATRPWPVFDAVSPWLNAGSPMLATYTNSATKPAGIANYANVGLTSTQFSPAGTPIPTQSLRNQGQTPAATYAYGLPASNNLRSLINSDIYPLFGSSYSLMAYRMHDFKTYSAFLEQQITHDCFIEAAVFKLKNDQHSLNGFVGTYDLLYVDVNRQLPNGTPNPNAGMYYTESRTSLLLSPTESLSKRVMASYELDFARKRTNWIRHFGRHRMALFGEQSDRKVWNSNLGTQNVTPLATTGAAAAIRNGGNELWYRYYYNPAAGIVAPTGGQYGLFPVLFANTPLPARDPSGVTPAWVSIAGNTASDWVVRTGAFVVQSSFWRDRVILTNGLRLDSQKAWSAVPADFDPHRDANGIGANPRNFDLRSFVPGSAKKRDGHTYTHGLVVHALSWLSLSFNMSNNLQINPATRNVYGDVLPNPQGEGRDYGLKLALFDRRFFFDLTYYTNATKDKIEAAAGTQAGNLSQFEQIWQAIGAYTNDPKYLSPPYALGNTWYDSASTRSTGWEFSATVNPTPQWRFIVNGSRRSTSTTTARGVYIRQYLAQYLPIIKANPQWMALPAPTAVSVGARVADLETVFANFEAIKGLPEDVYAPNWTLNVIQTYSFPRESRFTGFSVGGSVNARGRCIDGFAEDAANVLVPTQPYYAPTYELFGAWITYQRKVFAGRINWRIQLNVRNVFDAYTLFPLRMVDTRDGTHRHATAIYRLSEPRTFTLTSTFKF